jgi:hypothetical protein
MKIQSSFFDTNFKTNESPKYGSGVILLRGAKIKKYMRRKEVISLLQNRYSRQPCVWVRFPVMGPGNYFVDIDSACFHSFL